MKLILFPRILTACLFNFVVKENQTEEGHVWAFAALTTYNNDMSVNEREITLQELEQAQMEIDFVDVICIQRE
jgi:aminopeptidase C